MANGRVFLEFEFDDNPARIKPVCTTIYPRTASLVLPALGAFLHVECVRVKELMQESKDTENDLYRMICQLETAIHTISKFKTTTDGRKKT